MWLGSLLKENCALNDLMNIPTFFEISRYIVFAQYSFVKAACASWRSTAARIEFVAVTEGIPDLSGSELHLPAIGIGSEALGIKALGGTHGSTGLAGWAGRKVAIGLLHWLFVGHGLNGLHKVSFYKPDEVAFRRIGFDKR